MGITTFYKHDPDGSLWIKMHGTMDGVGVTDQLATVREVDLFNKWVPFCNTSTLLKRLGIVELLVYFSMSAPGFSRWVASRKYRHQTQMEPDNSSLTRRQMLQEHARGVSLHDECC